MSKRRSFMLIIALLCVIIFACACTGKKPDPVIKQQDITSEPSPDDNDDTTVAPLISNEEFNLIAIKYYTVNPDTFALKSTTAMVREDAEVTPSLILDYLCDSLEDESVTLSYKSADISDGICTINFDDSIVGISKQSAELEMAILDAASQSILDNVDGCKGVRLRINDEAYSTQNFKFALDDIYMDD